MKFDMRQMISVVGTLEHSRVASLCVGITGLTPVKAVAELEAVSNKTPVPAAIVIFLLDVDVAL